jgi:lipoprotein-anchoring transpeptidase ErfK/SrfK
MNDTANPRIRSALSILLAGAVALLMGACSVAPQQSAEAVRLANTGPRIPYARSSSGKALEVDKGNQMVYAIENGQVLKAMNASTGNGQSYKGNDGRTRRATTPSGSYRIVSQRNGYHESSLGLGTMYRPKYFTSGGLAIHGSPHVPRYPASHGCVRVSNANMDWIWDVWGAPIGTRVLVY